MTTHAPTWCRKRAHARARRLALPGAAAAACVALAWLLLAPAETMVLAADPLGDMLDVAESGAASEPCPGSADAPRQRVPTAQVEDAAPPAKQPKAAGTERAFRARFAAIAHQTPERFAEEVEQTLSGRRPLAEQVAALQIARAIGHAEAGRWQAETLRDATRPQALRLLVVRQLASESAREPATRQALVTFVRARPADGCLRAAALEAVLAHGTFAEVRSCLDLLDAETDPGVRERALAALRGNDRAQGAAIAAELGR